jgi:DNA-binding response OmpR family regulator
MEPQFLFSLQRWGEPENHTMLFNFSDASDVAERTEHMSYQILVVDDEPHVRLAYRMTLEAESYAVHQADCAETALERMVRESFDLAILDLRLPGMDGLDLLAEMRNRNILVPVVMITAHGDVPNAVRAMHLGAIDFLQKPLTPESLRTVVADVFARHAAPPSATAPADDFASHFSEAKRLINLRTFGAAWTHLSRALELSQHSPDALNLAGVLFEMQQDYERAGKLYEMAIKYESGHEPAKQNLRRLTDLCQSGSSNEPFNLGR